MNNGPPTPFRDPSWASIVLGLSLAWQQVKVVGDQHYGRLVSGSGVPYYLVPAAAGSTPNGGVLWTVSTSVPSGFVEHLMLSNVATVLLNGTDNSDGSIAYNGSNYKIHQWWTGADHIAKLVAA